MEHDSLEASDLERRAEDISILVYQNNVKKRRLREAIEIEYNTVDFQQDSEKIGKRHVDN